MPASFTLFVAATEGPRYYEQLRTGKNMGPSRKQKGRKGKGKGKGNAGDLGSLADRNYSFQTIVPFLIPVC